MHFWNNILSFNNSPIKKNASKNSPNTLGSTGCQVVPDCKCVTSSHDNLLCHTNATSANETRWYAPLTTAGLSSLGHVHHNTLEYINALTEIPGPKSTLTIREHFTSENLLYYISYRRCFIFILLKLGKASEVNLVNICKAYARTLLDFLWPNLSTLRATVLQMSRCVVWICVVAPTSSKNNRRCSWFFSLEQCSNMDLT